MMLMSYEPPAFNVKPLVKLLFNAFVMRGEDKRRAVFAAQTAQKPQHNAAVFRIKACRGFICQKQYRLVDNGAHNVPETIDAYNDAVWALRHGN